MVRVIIESNKKFKLQLKVYGLIQSAIDILCMMPHDNVKYLVILLIFCLPVSPSFFCISSSVGMIFINSCVIIDEFIYGMIPKLNIPIVENPPPEKIFKKLTIVFLFKLAVISAWLMPGIGINIPILEKNKMINVIKILCLSVFFYSYF